MRKFPRKLSKTVKQQIIEKFIKLEVQPRRYNIQVIAFTDREIKGKGEKKISNKTLEEHFWDTRDIGFTIESIQHNERKKTQTGHIFIAFQALETMILKASTQNTMDLRIAALGAAGKWNNAFPILSKVDLRLIFVIKGNDQSGMRKE